MNSDSMEDTTTYKVVVNHEEQYSIWPSEKKLPLGWTATGTTGSKDRMPGAYQGSLDRHETAQLEIEDGSAQGQIVNEPVDQRRRC